MPHVLKSGLFIAACIALIMSAISMAARFYLLDSYADLERESAARTAAALRRAWQEELSQLRVSVENYAYWDDMYQFVRRPNIPFVQSNLAVTSMSNLRVDTVLVTDERGTPVFWRRFADPDNRGFPDARLLIADLPPDLLSLPPGAAAGTQLTGVLKREGGDMLLSIAPILPTKGSAAARGHLLFARALDENVLAELGAATGLRVERLRTQAASLPGPVREAAARARTVLDTLTSFDDERSATHLLVPDIAGAPALVLRVTEPRLVYQRGLDTIHYLLWGALALCLLFGAVALVLWLRMTRHWARRKESEARYRAVVAQASEGILLVDAATQQIVEANRAFLQLAGYANHPAAELRLSDVFPPGRLNTPALARALEPGGPPVELKLRTLAGATCDAEVTTSVITYHGREVFCLVARDVTARKAADVRLRASEKRLDHLAHHDPLTGLPNRLFLQGCLRQALAAAEASGVPLALLFLDVDRFKFINDTRGHETGDELLKQAAQRLSAAAGSDRQVVRMGGDEFVIVMPDATDDDGVAQVAQRILDALRQPFWLGDLQFLVTGSLGISVYPRDARDPSMLIRSADAAMYHAKEKGRNHFQFFHPSLNSRLTRRVQLETKLRTAVAEGQFRLLYQPQVDLRSGAIVGVEALLRWSGDDAELQSPETFIQVAEETGLIVPIGEWVLREACRMRRAWQDRLPGRFRMAVNLSPSQLRRPEFPARLQSVLAETGLAAELLEVELTESAFMQHAAEEARPLHLLRELGIGVAVDDFGVGYSSLSYLKHFPVTKLKIDRSFVRDLTTDPNDAAIVRAILALAHSMSIPACAEGVEAANQVEFLAAQGCDYAQGNYFAAPLETDDCFGLLAGTESGSVTVRLRPPRQQR